MEGGQPTGPHSRDNRQIKALTGLSQAQFDYLLPVFSDIYQTRMIPLVSVLGFGTWSFLIKEQLYYWRSSGGGKIVAAYDSISGTPLETAYYSPGSKTATAYLDLKTDEWI